MKIAINIMKAIIIFVLTVVIVGIVFVKIISSTILNEAYIMSVLKTSKYYENLHKDVKSNFEKYIGPSGIDENILENICTVEDLEKDTETILGNIYEGTDKKVDTTEIKQRVIKNVNDAVEKQGGIVEETNKSSIDKFADTIADEYIVTILHTDYEEAINKMYKKVLKITNLAQKALFVCLTIILVLLVLLNIKTIYSSITNIAVSVLSAGIFLFVTNYIINYKIKIEQMKILNDSISIVLQNIIKNCLYQVTRLGIECVILGAVAILIGSFLIAWKTEE